MPLYAAPLPCTCGRQYALAVLTQEEAAREFPGLAVPEGDGVEFLYCEHGQGTRPEAATLPPVPPEVWGDRPVALAPVPRG